MNLGTINPAAPMPITRARSRISLRLLEPLLDEAEVVVVVSESSSFVLLVVAFCEMYSSTTFLFSFEELLLFELLLPPLFNSE